jgi:hypothetical protein
MALPNTKILKVAGLSLIGFCAVSIGVDKANIGPVASQLASFCGALLGGLVAQRRVHRISKGPEKQSSEPPKAASEVN